MQIPQDTHFEGYFALDALYSFIRWLEGFISILEELISVLSGPLLAIGLSFSLVDFLMQGSLLKNPSIALSWSIVQAAAVDAQLVLMWHKSKMAIRARNGLAFCGFVLLGVALAFVAFGAVALQSLQQSAGMDSVKALQSLGLTAEELVYARSAVAIILACVAGWTRSPIGHVSVLKSPSTPQKKEDKQPGFFAKNWEVVKYWFQLRKMVKDASKKSVPLPDNQASQEDTEPTEPNQLPNTEPPALETEVLPSHKTTEETQEVLQKDTTETEQENHDDGPDTDEIVLPTTKITQPLPVAQEVKTPNRQPIKKVLVASKKDKIFKYLKKHPDATITDIMRYASVTKSYASTIRSEFLESRQKVA